MSTPVTRIPLGNPAGIHPTWRDPRWAKVDGVLCQEIVSEPVWLLLARVDDWVEGFWIQHTAPDAGRYPSPVGFYCEPYGPALDDVLAWLPRAEIKA